MIPLGIESDTIGCRFDEVYWVHKLQRCQNENKVDWQCDNIWCGKWSDLFSLCVQSIVHSTPKV